jgi:mandelamide amidase
VQAAGAIIVFERVPAITHFLEAEGTGITYEQLIADAGEDIKAMAAQPPREAYEAALEARLELQAAVRSRFASHGLSALVYPTTYEHAPRIGDTADAAWGGQPVTRVAATARSTFLAPCLGVPGLVLPAGLSASGLPIGVEFDGLPGTDRQLLALGLAVERTLGPIPAPNV